MTKWTTALVLVGCLGFAGSAAAADRTWHVTEGKDGRRAGVWHIRVDGARISGRGEMNVDGGRKVSFNVQGERRGDEIILQRVGATDGSHCAYRGKLGPDKRVSGTALCGRTAMPWLAAVK